MERLTVPDKKIEGGWRRAVIDTREVRKEAMTVYWALKKYEDTGLTPEEVIELRERDTKKLLTDLKACPNCGRYIGDDIRPLEKILEEIERCIARAEKIIVIPPHDKLDQVANDTAEAFIEAYKECEEIIYKHMNDGNDGVDLNTT